LAFGKELGRAIGFLGVAAIHEIAAPKPLDVGGIGLGSSGSGSSFR